MAPVICIVFQNPSRIFFPGQQISGYVEVHASQRFSYKAISLKLIGLAKVHFTKNRKNDNETKTIHYNSKEEYYSMIYKLCGDGSTTKSMAAGNHQFPFNFMLPYSIPSSFESKHGSIRHFCEATIESTHMLKLNNIRTLSPYSVVSIYDLNNDPTALRQIILSKDKSLCCLCCKSGPISLTVNIDHSGYVPGEKIIINAECSNKSNRKMSSTRAEIIQVIDCKANGEKNTECRTVCFKEHPEIPPGEDDIWGGECLKIGRAHV